MDWAAGMSGGASHVWTVSRCREENVRWSTPCLDNRQVFEENGSARYCAGSLGWWGQVWHLVPRRWRGLLGRLPSICSGSCQGAAMPSTGLCDCESLLTPDGAARSVEGSGFAGG